MMDGLSAEDRSSGPRNEKLAPAALAALIVDALIDAGIIDKEQAEVSIAIAAEEINARKALGDY
jgi:hypothetical protein